MKKYNISALILLFLVVFSCSDSDDNNSDDDSTNPVGNVDRSGNLLDTGESANDILSNTNFTKLQVEIAYVEGFRPTNTSMAGFQEYLEQHTFKDDVELIFNELPSSGEEDLTLNEIDDLEQENRTAFNTDDTIAIYIYFADAPSDGDDEDEGLVTLGAVFRNTSMVIYESTVIKLANTSSVISVADIEEATLNHEFGHLFGLVNLGTPAINDHEDVLLDDDGNPVLDSENKPVGNNHCNVVGCLMRAELSFSSSKEAVTTEKSGLKSSCNLTGKSMMKILESSSLTGKAGAPDLDPECVLDIQANGAR